MTKVENHREFFSGGGQLGALIRAKDWSKTPLGPPETWPQSLRTSVSTCLNCSFPILIWWGPELVKIYNDAYADILAAKHPRALGSAGREVWPEIWDTIGPMLNRVMDAGAAFPADDLRLDLHRKGYPEECYFSFSYSPIRDEAGRIAGVFCPVIETTDRVFAGRRAAFLLNLESRLRAALSARAALDVACEAIGRELGGVICTFNEFDVDDVHIEVTSEWRSQGAPSALGRHRLADWGESREPDLRSGAPERVEDIRSDPRTAGTAAEDAYAALGCRASLNAPLLRGGRVVAMLAIGVAEPHRWTDYEVTLALETVDRTWSAVERARAEDALRKADAALLDSEERLRLAVDNAEVGFWDVDEINDTLIWPARTKAMFGVSADAAVSMQDFYSGLHPDDLDSTAAAYAAATDPERRALYDVEYRTIGKEDGVVRWIAAKGRGVFDGAGSDARCLRVTGTAVEITARKLSELAVHELNETLERRVAETAADFARVWRNANDIIVVIDGEGVFRRVNPATTAILGWAERELIGQAVLGFIHPDDLASTLGALEHARTDTLRTFENRYSCKDGSWRLLSWVAAPEGELIYAYGRDVTLERERQAELEIAQQALRQSQKMEAMGQLTGGVAHDFNNLLTPIVGSLDMLQRKGLGGEREQRLIAGAVESAERAKVLVQRLLAFARRQPLQSVPVDVAKLVTGMGDLVSSTTGPQIKVMVEAPGNLPPAVADPNQVEMALLNLAVNARDAMPGGGTLRITATAESVETNHASKLRPGAYVRLSVADTGTGMDEATLARAIEPFFSTKGVGRGTGLGLSMVHGLASQLGGALTIQSRPGLGTNVELWLPQSDTQPDAPGPVGRAPDLPEGRGVVLLVDDEELVRISTADMLADLGYEVIEAASAEEAIVLASQGSHFDLLLTDHLMPGMSGIDLANAIGVSKPGLPVLVVSGYAENEGIEPGLPRLTKPFRKDQLAASLTQLSIRPNGS